MADRTKIEWTATVNSDGSVSPGATWNPITGCAVVSPGCTNCYAMRLAGTRLQHHPSRTGLTRHTKAGPVWTGEVRFNQRWLDQPLRWRRPRRIFVCAHGDLFAESVPDGWIDRVFAVMALAPQHTFLVLTKRAERMREYLTATERHGPYDAIIAPRRSTRMLVAEVATEFVGHSKRPKNLITIGDALDFLNEVDRGSLWPLPNVWLGLSVEDQPRADERIPDLLATPAAVHFVSAEPLLSQINLRQEWLDRTSSKTPAISWLICGGESGPGARPTDVDWLRSIRAQCAAAGVACFVKQLGAKPMLHGFTGMPIRDKKGADWLEWPEDLRVREFPEDHNWPKSPSMRPARAISSSPSGVEGGC